MLQLCNITCLHSPTFIFRQKAIHTITLLIFNEIQVTRMYMLTITSVQINTHQHSSTSPKKLRTSFLPIIQLKTTGNSSTGKKFLDIGN